MIREVEREVSCDAVDSDKALLAECSHHLLFHESLLSFWRSLLPGKQQRPEANRRFPALPAMYLCSSLSIYIMYANMYVFWV
jgi:hypothetical protein